MEESITMNNSEDDEHFENNGDEGEMEEIFDDDYITRKLLHTLLTFNVHYTDYIKQNDPEMNKRAIDYAKTFTEEDIPGTIFEYLQEDKKEDKEDTNEN